MVWVPWQWSDTILLRMAITIILERWYCVRANLVDGFFVSLFPDVVCRDLKDHANQDAVETRKN